MNQLDIKSVSQRFEHLGRNNDFWELFTIKRFFDTKEKKREANERKILRGEKHRTRPIIFSDKRNDEDEKKKKRSMKKKMKSKRICKSRQSVSFISSRVSRLAECLRLNIPI